MKKIIIISFVMIIVCLFTVSCRHDHEFGEWFVESEPACAEKGSEKRICSCGAYESRDIPPTEEHIYGEWIICGELCPVYKREERKCTLCSQGERRTVKVQAEHEYTDFRLIQNASCTDNGEAHIYCSCGEYITEIIPIEHNIITEEAMFPTDSREGFTEYVYCSVCQKVWAERISVGKLTQRETDMFTYLGYEGNTRGEITLKWEATSEFSKNIFGFIVEVSIEGQKEKYNFFAKDGDPKIEMPQKSGKYTISVYPVDMNGGVGSSKAVEVNWYPEILELDFPRVEITTLNGELPTFTRVDHPEESWGISITDNNYVQSLVSVYDGDDNLLYRSSENDFDEAKIKVRGNTSALGRKHPFKIKLNYKADLLKGLVNREDGVDYREKDWVLLSEGKNYSYVTGSAIADLVGGVWTPEYCYVTLFVNGDYRGLYILIESVEKGEGRCDISDTGYIVEMDSYWWNEELYFTTPISEDSEVKPTFKYPDADDLDASSPEYTYIKEYMTKMEQALLSGEGAEDYIDYDSAMRWLLIHDILATYDSGGSNMYMTKYDSTEDSRLCFGPLWDYGSIYSYDAGRFARIRSGKFFYMYLLVKDETFMTMYYERYNEIRKSVIDAMVSALGEYDNEVHEFILQYEGKRWGSQTKTAGEEIELSRNWMEDHLDWMDEKVVLPNGEKYIVGDITVKETIIFSR